MIEDSIKILSNNSVTSDTFLLRLYSPELAASANPGQFLMVRVNEGIDPVLRRPFSICGVEDDGTIKILYKVVGKGTTILSKRKQGECLSVLGPLGKGFNLPDESQKTFYVAGGIGIAPMLFLCQKTDSSNITFLTGFRNSDEIIDPALTGNKIHNLIATDDGSNGYNGRVTELLVEHLEQYKQNDTAIYACGPLPMLKAVKDVSQKYGIPCQVSMETLMACGLGACQGCIVRSDISRTNTSYLHVCKEGPVFDVNDIDWKNI